MCFFHELEQAHTTKQSNNKDALTRIYYYALFQLRWCFVFARVVSLGAEMRTAQTRSVFCAKRESYCGSLGFAVQQSEWISIFHSRQSTNDALKFRVHDEQRHLYFKIYTPAFVYGDNNTDDIYLLKLLFGCSLQRAFERNGEMRDIIWWPIIWL